jgi:hypothetical protein
VFRSCLSIGESARPDACKTLPSNEMYRPGYLTRRDVILSRLGCGATLCKGDVMAAPMPDGLIAEPRTPTALLRCFLHNSVS